MFTLLSVYNKYGYLFNSQVINSKEFNLKLTKELRLLNEDITNQEVLDDVDYLSIKGKRLAYELLEKFTLLPAHEKQKAFSALSLFCEYFASEKARDSISNDEFMDYTCEFYRYFYKDLMRYFHEISYEKGFMNVFSVEVYYIILVLIRDTL